MRFYPNADINNYSEIPSTWSLYSRNPYKSWRRRLLQTKHYIAYWCDLEGAKMPVIMEKDLYIKNWSYDRIRPEACLPWYYCVGNRFIRLEKAFPHGFKCSLLPMNLKEVRSLNEHEKEMAQMKRAKEKEAERLAEEMAKLERKKKGLRK